MVFLCCHCDLCLDTRSLPDNLTHQDTVHTIQTLLLASHIEQQHFNIYMLYLSSLITEKSSVVCLLGTNCIKRPVQPTYLVVTFHVDVLQPELLKLIPSQTFLLPKQLKNPYLICKLHSHCYEGLGSLWHDTLTLHWVNASLFSLVLAWFLSLSLFAFPATSISEVLFQLQCCFQSYFSCLPGDGDHQKQHIFLFWLCSGRHAFFVFYNWTLIFPGLVKVKARLKGN